jgi:hypothetical protein
MIRVDDSKWPVLAIQFREQLSELEFTDYLSEFGRCVRRGEHFAIAVDTATAVPVWGSHKLIRAQATFIIEHRGDLERLCLGAGVSIDSPLVRGGVRAFMYLVREMPFPLRITDSYVEAVSFAEEAIRRIEKG